MADEIQPLGNSTPSSLTSKQVHYARLNVQLSELEKNIKKLQENLQVTAEQIPSFRKLGTLHSSILMSSSRVLSENDTTETNRDS
ncbi:hypothetical protein J3Q64DRAFT_1729448 [Phycomyces blakesleeanus]|uniref:Uncharacterized protein n=2 Tax=Phycomyces blakesleeanus TaxID=4837 RepID=A0A167NLY3_PHYB8|nr:hypothetical protein PHYBLDRAFT_143220 [Phycomyces blakesleeanus NRRL 1555(-)]OAD76239.1 hypothetical protein PHYBLDRAFT_143220 [Phycomyces blakesleeanus NRRL 1555(-)]|eukprot:XP_018294279.1 hypothetical protein PHYBLDRAFT_143220 [Phycomyces blakesleeanus NRRL 1555(-)]